jgi:hypothetical protein
MARSSGGCMKRQLREDDKAYVKEEPTLMERETWKAVAVFM